LNVVFKKILSAGKEGFIFSGMLPINPSYVDHKISIMSINDLENILKYYFNNIHIYTMFEGNIETMYFRASNSDKKLYL
jgi:hypothetical protein